NLTGDDVATLLRSPRLPCLESLDICYNREIGTEGMRTMAALPEFTRVRIIDLQGVLNNPTALRHLVESPNVKGMRELHLACCGLGDEGLQAVAKSQHLSELAQLWLYDNAIGAEGCRALGQSMHLRLASLSLTSNQLGSEGVAALASGDALSGLRHLSLF